jgi:hypothetical protein
VSATTSRTNWFVATGVGYAGDGSLEKPFHDLWKAIRSASPGDAIHVAAGTYFGRYDRSSWIIDCPNLTIRGGYSDDFASRNPWKTPSVLAFFPNYKGVRENNMISWTGDHSGLTLDGLLFDAAGANTYGDGPLSAITWWPQMSGEIASFNGEHVTVCNCAFINGANGGVQLSGSGSRFENNLLLNLIGLSMLDLRSSSQMIAEPIVVRNNSFCFIHDVSDPPGSGADAANGVRINCPAEVQDNLFVSCGNAGISVFIDPTRVSIDRNLFFLSPHDAIRSNAQDSAGQITEKNLDELEDLGFKSAGDNAVRDPGVAGLKSEWVDAYSRQLLATYAKPPRDAANALRAAAGLPTLQQGELDKPESKGALAPRFAPEDALKVAFAAKQGAHAADQPAEKPESSPKAVLSYRRIEWSAFDTPDTPLANSRVELVAGLGTEQNNQMLPDAMPETHMGVRIYKPGSDDVEPFVFIPRWTLPARQYQEATRYERGLDVETIYLVRGVYRSDVSSSRQKVTLVVESIVPAPISARIFPARPQGRDWFVRAGSSGGDGSREKPFRDPFQAIEKAEGGDSIHVATGDYFGKVHAGKWRITIRNLALVGGYNADFTARDPWSNPCRFLLHEDEKAKPGMPEGKILGSEDNSEGLVLDGFIFDGATWNTYKDGSIDLGSSPLAPLIDLSGGRLPITVRNCLFLNASCGAVKISCPYGEFANNVILNTSGLALAIRADGPGPWTITKNTILFCSDPTPRAGTGESTTDGTILMLNGRAAMNVDSNILAFADNFGVRCTVPQPGVSICNNVLAANLYNQLADANYLWADNSNWARRAMGDSSFASIQGNSLELPQLPVDPACADAALSRLFKLPSHISADEWKKIAQRIGASVSPEPPPSAAAPAAAKPAETPAAKPSLNDLMARLGHLDAQKIQAEQATTKPQGEAPKYCPQFDWKKAMDLALQSATPAAGAHRKQIAVAFSAGQDAKAAVDYVRIPVEHLDAVRADLNGKPIEMDVSDLRESSTSMGLFPAGTSKNDYTAYTVAVIAGGDSPRTRVAVVVKDDTTAAKYLNRMVPTDKIRVRGTAYTAPESYQLSVLVDSAVPVGG